MATTACSGYQDICASSQISSVTKSLSWVLGINDTNYMPSIHILTRQISKLHTAIKLFHKSGIASTTPLQPVPLHTWTVPSPPHTSPPSPVPVWAPPQCCPESNSLRVRQPWHTLYHSDQFKKRIKQSIHKCANNQNHYKQIVQCRRKGTEVTNCLKSMGRN